MDRHALHAHRLTFEGRTVEAPLPADMPDFLRLPSSEDYA